MFVAMVQPNLIQLCRLLK